MRLSFKRCLGLSLQLPALVCLVVGLCIGVIYVTEGWGFFPLAIPWWEGEAPWWLSLLAPLALATFVLAAIWGRAQLASKPLQTGAIVVNSAAALVVLVVWCSWLVIPFLPHVL